MKFTIILLSLFSLLNVQAQEAYNINGKIENETKTGVDLALIHIFKADDTTLVKTAFTDKDGTYIITALQADKYIYRIKFTGYHDHWGEFEADSSKELDLITLEVNDKLLGQVTIDGSVPFIERKIDRIVVTPDALISSAGSTALEILEQAPGVLVDQDGQISLKGRSGVAIYINDKPSYLSGTELENYLRSLPAGSIKNIEVIENPPARYEAAGNAGIININIKRSALRGFFGNTSVSYRRSRYNSSHNNLNLNYNRKKIGFSTSLNAGLWESFQDLNINRYYLDDIGNQLSAFNQNSFNNNKGQYLNGRFAVDFYPKDRTTFGVSYKRSHSPGERDNDNTSLISDNSGNLLQRVVAENLSQTTFDNDLVSAYFVQKLDSVGSSISVDADFVQYRSSNDQDFRNFQYDPQDNLIYNDQINGEIPSRISIYALKSDFTKLFKDGSSFEAGLKTAFTQTDNEAIYSNTIDGVTTPDYNLSNRFIYEEWINAAYLNYNRSIGKTTIQVGLRGENTQLLGNQLGNLVTPDTSFRRNYTSLFPTLYVARPLDSAGFNNLNFSYGRRIERPYFQDLNPFISPLDKFTFYTGNPNLLPTFSHNMSLTYSFKSLLSTSLSYSLIVDGINETLEIQDEIYYSRPGNIATSQYLTLSVNANIPVTKWYVISTYAEASFVKFESQLYTEQLNASGVNVFASLSNTFKLKKGWKISVSARYSNDQVYSQLLIRNYAFMNCGIEKTILKGRGSLRFSASDLFYSRRGDGVINNLADTNADWNSKYDSRGFRFAFSWRFGKSKFNKQKHDGSGSESEQNRVKS